MTGKSAIRDPKSEIGGFAVIVIGTSLGGLQALEVLLSRLPADFPLPVIIVQHRHPDSDERLVAHLQTHCPLPISDAEDKEPVLARRVYLAPADYHLLVEQESFALSLEAPVNFARPSIDVLFESAADAYREKVIGVVLTGASRDGADGAARIKARGGLIVVQDPATAEGRMMPEAVIAMVEPDRILLLEEIAEFLVEAVKR
jgi:two-component system chemotaxis response regulator CheB